MLPAAINYPTIQSGGSTACTECLPLPIPASPSLQLLLLPLLLIRKQQNISLDTTEIGEVVSLLLGYMKYADGGGGGGSISDRTWWKCVSPSEIFKAPGPGTLGN